MIEQRPCVSLASFAGTFIYSDKFLKAKPGQYYVHIIRADRDNGVEQPPPEAGPGGHDAPTAAQAYQSWFGGLAHTDQSQNTQITCPMALLIIKRPYL